MTSLTQLPLHRPAATVRPGFRPRLALVLDRAAELLSGPALRNTAAALSGARLARPRDSQLEACAPEGALTVEGLPFCADARISIAAQVSSISRSAAL